MPYCPKCNEEYVEGMSACTNCGADLVDSPLDGEEGQGMQGFDTVFVGPASEALEMKSALEEEGFSAVLQGMDGAVLAADEIEEDVGKIHLLVPEEMTETAREIIDAMEPVREEDEDTDLFDEAILDKGAVEEEAPEALFSAELEEEDDTPLGDAGPEDAREEPFPETPPGDSENTEPSHAGRGGAKKRTGKPGSSSGGRKPPATKTSGTRRKTAGPGGKKAGAKKGSGKKNRAKKKSPKGRKKKKKKTGK